MRKQLLFVAAIVVSVVSFGCAITDYDGFADRHTESEAKLWGTEVAFSGTGDAELDGTYSYSAKYDNRGGQGDVTITTYRNPVVGSFSRDGQVDRDGDEIQGRGGILGGKFQTRYVAVDELHPTCEFFANIKQSKGPDAQILKPLSAFTGSGRVELTASDLEGKRAEARSSCSLSARGRAQPGGDSNEATTCSSVWSASDGHDADAIGRCFEGFEMVRVVDTGEAWGGRQYAICQRVPGNLPGWPYPLFQFRSPGGPSRRFR